MFIATEQQLDSLRSVGATYRAPNGAIKKLICPFFYKHFPPPEGRSCKFSFTTQRFRKLRQTSGTSSISPPHSGGIDMPIPNETTC